MFVPLCLFFFPRFVSSSFRFVYFFFLIFSPRLVLLSEQPNPRAGHRLLGCSFSLWLPGPHPQHDAALEAVGGIVAAAPSGTGGIRTDTLMVGG